MQPYPSIAQDKDFASDTDTTLFPANFFDQADPLEITLAFDIKKYKKEKSDEEYLPAKLTYTSNTGVPVERDVRVRARGEYRRNYCFLPPYWINIKKSDISNDHLADVKKIKVVSHCKDANVYRGYLIKEYLAYKIYNIITDYSFKVRLLKVNYIDTGRKNKSSTEMAFMLEPEDLLSERLEAYPLEMDKLKYSQTDSMLTTTMSVFQFMIGNTDYSVTGRHNLKLLTLKDYTKPSVIPIPYDFDFSGLVNTNYALPSPKISITKVTERYFYGMCRSDRLYGEILELFVLKKDEIFALVENFEYISKKNKKYILSYLSEFYAMIEKDSFVEKYFRTTCE